MATQQIPQTTIAGVKVPDTNLIKAAKDYVRERSDDMTYNHVIRSWLFSALISQKLHETGALPAIDQEALAISAVFHDLGWDKTGELVSVDKRFEIDGAIAAVKWITKQDAAATWDEHRCQLVWDTIALHTTPSIAAHKQPLVAVASMGIACDFQGPKSDFSGTLTWDEFNAVNAEFPRHNLAQGIREIMCGFCRVKPATTYDTFMMEYGRKYVDDYDTNGKLAINLVEGSA